MMKMQEGVRPAVAAAGRTAETGTSCETTSNSAFYDTTAADVRQIKIKDFLLAGVENAVPQRHLRQLIVSSAAGFKRNVYPEFQSCQTMRPAITSRRMIWSGRGSFALCGAVPRKFRPWRRRWKGRQLKRGRHIQSE